MNLLVLEINHKKAPLEIRERFALKEETIPEALRRLHGEPEIEEAVIISTCNRVEFILMALEKQDGMAGFRRFAEGFYGVCSDEFAHCFFVHRDEEAVQHLFRVAAGLDSLIVGEPQILGQVKQAYSLAKEAETCGHALEAVFQCVFNTAKRVRTETHVAEAPVSVSSAAVELAEQAFGGLQDKTVMIIGAGQMAELAMRHLVSKGVATVLVSNRTHAHALTLAIDGLEEVTHHNLRERQMAMQAADRILDEEVELFRAHQDQLNVVPTIVSLKRRVEEIRQAEMKRMRRLFGELTPAQEQALEALTHGLVNKILHTPFTELKQAAQRPDRSEFIDAVRTIFRLREAASGPTTTPAN